MPSASIHWGGQLNFDSGPSSLNWDKWQREKGEGPSRGRWQSDHAGKVGLEGGLVEEGAVGDDDGQGGASWPETSPLELAQQPRLPPGFLAQPPPTSPLLLLFPRLLLLLHFLLLPRASELSAWGQARSCPHSTSSSALASSQAGGRGGIDCYMCRTHFMPSRQTGSHFKINPLDIAQLCSRAYKVVTLRCTEPQYQCQSPSNWICQLTGFSSQDQNKLRSCASDFLASSAVRNFPWVEDYLAFAHENWEWQLRLSCRHAEESSIDLENQRISRKESFHLRFRSAGGKAEFMRIHIYSRSTQRVVVSTGPGYYGVSSVIWWYVVVGK